MVVVVHGMHAAVLTRPWRTYRIAPRVPSAVQPSVIMPASCMPPSQDPTVILLTMAGLVSLVLQLVTTDESGSADWIEGAAILAAVAIVVGVGSITNFQKESKFRQLNTLKDDIRVGMTLPSSSQDWLSPSSPSPNSPSPLVHARRWTWPCACTYV